MEQRPEPLYDLFVVSNETNSMKALRLHNACGTRECAVRDVRQMEQIPQFLKGVPSLYIRRSKLVMTGTQCLNFLQSLEEKEEVPPGKGARGGGGNRIHNNNRKSNFVSKATPREYSDEKITSLDLEKILQERKNQFART